MATEGGLFPDLAAIDPSEPWELARQFGLAEVIRAGTITAGSPEVVTAWQTLTMAGRKSRDWANLSSLEREKARVGGLRALCRVFGVRASRIPEPGTEVDLRALRPLLGALGFKLEEVGRARAEGRRYALTPLELAPPE
jgi:hypothetical protein